MGSKFEEWLEKEFPCHSHYDFETLFKYENWKVSLKKAYEAGWNACRDKWGGLEYGDPAND